MEIEKKLSVFTLGPPQPCAKCKKTRSNMEEALKELGENLDYSHKDMTSKEIVEKYGILQGPAVIVNDILISQGHIPTIKELKTGITKVKNEQK